MLALDDGYDSACNKLDRVQSPGSVVLFDTLTDEHLETIGRLIWDEQQREGKPLFVAGSSGIDYALVKHWQAAGIGPGLERTSSHRAAATHSACRSHGHSFRQLLARNRPTDRLGTRARLCRRGDRYIEAAAIEVP